MILPSPQGSSLSLHSSPHSSRPTPETPPCKVPYASSQAQAARRGPGKEEGFSDRVRSQSALYTPHTLPKSIGRYSPGGCCVKPLNSTNAGLCVSSIHLGHNSPLTTLTLSVFSLCFVGTPGYWMEIGGPCDVTGNCARHSPPRRTWSCGGGCVASLLPGSGDSGSGHSALGPESLQSLAGMPLTLL